MTIREEKVHPSVVNPINVEKVMNNHSTLSENRSRVKTITELVIDKELKEIDGFDELDVI